MLSNALNSPLVKVGIRYGLIAALLCMGFVVSMYYMDNMRMKEIGEVLNLSESRVSRLLASAELQLQSIVRRRGQE